MTQKPEHLGRGTTRRGTLHCSLDGSVLAVDQRMADMLGYRTWQKMMEEVLSIEQLFADPFEKTRVRGRIEDALTGNEARWLSAEGTSVFVRTRVHRLPGLRGEGIVLQIDADETTARHHLEERLRQILDASVLERAASGLSHEINQVLTYAIGHAELIAERIPEKLREETREDLEALQTAILDGARITSRLREMTRSRLLQPTAVDLTGFLSQVEPLVGHLFGPGTNLGVRTDAEGPATAYADRLTLEEVLVLLMSAVRDRHRVGSAIHLRVHAPSDPDATTWAGAPRLEVRFTDAEDEEEGGGDDTVIDAARVRLDEIGATFRRSKRAGGATTWEARFLGPALEVPERRSRSHATDAGQDPRQTAHACRAEPLVRGVLRDDQSSSEMIL